MTRITTHPGEILKEEFMEPLGLSARALAEALEVPANRLTAIINGHRSVTANTALRFARFFRTTPELWLNFQQSHDLSRERAQGGIYAAASVSLADGESLTLQKVLESLPPERRHSIEKRAGHVVRHAHKRKKSAPCPA